MAQNELVPATSLVAIGGSAGCLDVLLHVLPNVGVSTNSAIVLVMHRLSEGETQIGAVFNAKTRWMVKEAEDKDTLLPGCIYIAPGGYHLLIEKDGTCSLDSSEKVNYSRPSIDPTFETAAEAYGPRLKCLLLSGANADGVNGLQVARELGSTIAIQNPAEAIVSYMPEQAKLAIPDVRVLGLADIVSYLS